MLALTALGATPWEAAAPSVRTALRAGLIPTINSMAAVGIVFIPGMMTGQILAGADPLAATGYQIVVMLMVAAATALGSVLAVLLSYRRRFPPTASTSRGDAAPMPDESTQLDGTRGSRTTSCTTWPPARGPRACSCCWLLSARVAGMPAAAAAALGEAMTPMFWLLLAALVVLIVTGARAPRVLAHADPGRGASRPSGGR